jgi:hypothetical protein
MRRLTILGRLTRSGLDLMLDIFFCFTCFCMLIISLLWFLCIFMPIETQSSIINIANNTDTTPNKLDPSTIAWLTKQLQRQILYLDKLQPHKPTDTYIASLSKEACLGYLEKLHANKQ